MTYTQETSEKGVCVQFMVLSEGCKTNIMAACLLVFKTC